MLNQTRFPSFVSLYCSPGIVALAETVKAEQIKMPQEVGRRKAKEVGAELGKRGKLLVKRPKRKQKRGTAGEGDKVRKSSG